VSFIKISPQLFELSTLSLHPEVKFVSSSRAPNDESEHTVTSQMSGSARVSARPSPFIKEQNDFNSSEETRTAFNLEGTQIGETISLDFLSREILSASRPDSSGKPINIAIKSAMEDYLTYVNSASILPRNQKELPIKRFDSDNMFYEIRGFTDNDSARAYDETAYATASFKKQFIKNSLMPFYRSTYDSCDFSYTNYHCLNFFTASNVPSDTALIYLNSASVLPEKDTGGFPERILSIGSPELPSNLGTDANPVNRIIPNSGNPNLPTGLAPSDNSAFVQLGSDPRYALRGPFTFDFYINPRYHNGAADRDFKAGTILHLPNHYAISLVSGSERDEHGLTKGFRIMLQLNESCRYWEPSQIPCEVSSSNSAYKNQVVLGAATGSAGLIFVTPDNTLQRNHWHHISIRWGTNLINNGEGSIRVDNEEYDFTIPSASCMPELHLSASHAGALFVGNYYSGSDARHSSTDSRRFFNPTAATNEGLFDAFQGETGSYAHQGDPTGFLLDHPLNAEIHDVKIFAEYLSDSRVHSASLLGQSTTGSLLFYCPPFFVKETRQRNVLITPFISSSQTTNDPFNVSASFGVGGHEINLENFTRDFSTGQTPRLYKLTSSQGPTRTDSTGMLTLGIPRLKADNREFSFNDYMYSSSSIDASGFPGGAGTFSATVNSGSIQKRNLTVLPCDNGRFFPDYELLLSGVDTNEDRLESLQRGPLSMFKESQGGLNLSIISLDNLIGSGGNPPLFYPGQSSNILPLSRATPENPSFNAPEGLGLSIAQRTRDLSSNEIVIFDISNLYFGNRILPETFQIQDASLTGSKGAVQITLKDNGRGSLYRADSLTPHAKKASVGNIFYDEGLVIIKSPNIPFFGKDQFKISFKGEQSTHVLTVNVPCETGLHNSSSNPQFQLVSASFDPNEIDPRFVYIDGVNLHDDNLNVIMKAKLAQPVKKRNSDGILFKIKQDF